jgi:hypothetical protein
MSMENFAEPVSDPEADGLPDTADDDSTAYDYTASPREADGPDPAALPGDSPLAVDRFGITPEEAREGESLDYKLGRERYDGRGHATDVPADDRDQGDGVDLVSDEIDRPDVDSGLSEDWLDDPDDAAARSDRSDEPERPVGRLVEPDEGSHVDRDADAIAWDAGQAGGGLSAEEQAMHEISEP